MVAVIVGAIVQTLVPVIEWWQYVRGGKAGFAPGTLDMQWNSTFVHEVYNSNFSAYNLHNLTYTMAQVNWLEASWEY